MPLMYTTTHIRTQSGIMVDVLNTDPDDIQIEDIAHALSHLCRFGGHTPHFYSVAQHSYLCAMMAPARLQLTALLHDASEAYLVDVPSPIKPILNNYKTIEEHLELVIAKRFNLIYPFPETIRDIDQAMLSQEWNELIMQRNSVRFNCWTSEHAKHMFLDMFYELKINPKYDK